MNVGIRHHLARGARLLLCLTQDVRLRDGMLDALLAGAERASDFGVLAPVLWARDENRVFSYGGRRGRRGGWVAHITDRPVSAADGIAECDWADGSVLLIRRAVLERVGLLDESFTHYFEETDFLLRTTRAGWRVGVVLDAEAEQRSGAGARPAFHAYLLSRNGFEYAWRSSGLVGVVAAIRRAVLESWEAGGSYRAGTHSERSAVRTKLAGSWLGFFDFVRRRFGPPPQHLLREDR